MKNTFKLLSLLLMASHFSFGQSICNKIDDIVRSYRENNPEIGISVGFIKDDEEYYTAYGYLSKGSEIGINKNSVFEIASITKIITSNLIAQAVIEEKIELDDYIDDYLPKAYALHKNIRRKIKISDLASHQSGLPDIDFKALIELNPQQPTSSVNINTLSTLINNCSELIDYGKYRYSTISYVLLGQILEKIYGKSYDEIIREKIILPLQMTNTLTTNFNVTNNTTGYNSNGEVQEFLNWSIMAPAGLLKSNATDMITYLKYLLKEGNTISKAGALTEKPFYKDKNRKMGLGTNISTDEKNTIYLKSGDSMGQSSIICYNRVKNWGIIILLNQRNSKMSLNLLIDIYEKALK